MPARTESKLLGGVFALLLGSVVSAYYFPVYHFPLAIMASSLSLFRVASGATLEITVI
jgi:hypothetical protein